MLTVAEWIRAHINEPIPILRLCDEIGVSPRQLEYAFRTAFDIGPREFTHILRLNEIRRRLIKARHNAPTVTEVALDCGINHLSLSQRAIVLSLASLPGRRCCEPDARAAIAKIPKSHRILHELRRSNGATFTDGRCLCL